MDLRGGVVRVWYDRVTRRKYRNNNKQQQHQQHVPTDQSPMGRVRRVLSHAGETRYKGFRRLESFMS